jgi:hypothetical protein
LRGAYLVVWFQQELAQYSPFVQAFGILRLLRDVLRISSWVVYDEFETIKVLRFNPADPIARKLHFAFQHLFDPEHLDISLA